MAYIQLNTHIDDINVSRKKYERNGKNYVIVNNTNRDSYDEYSIYRSMILNETQQVLSYAPPKGLNEEGFYQKYGDDFASGKFQINQIIEGTMVNLFHDGDHWEISTKGAIGGNYWYYRNSYDEEDKKQMTFREMFVESLGYSRDTSFENIELISSLPKDHIYSFVVQHPDNHIVLDILHPALYLVSVFRKETECIVEWIPLSAIECWKVFKNSKILFPANYSVEVGELLTYESLCDVVNRNLTPGMMVTNVESGDRLAIRNNEYLRLKDLRGNNPNMQYHFYSLMRAGQVPSFLDHFPKYEKIFAKFSKQLHDFIRTIHDAYVVYYVQKRGKQVIIPQNIFTHIYKLHYDIHIPSIATGSKVIVTKQIVTDYIHSMEPKEIFYFINKKV